MKVCKEVFETRQSIHTFSVKVPIYEPVCAVSLLLQINLQIKLIFQFANQIAPTAWTDSHRINFSAYSAYSKEKRLKTTPTSRKSKQDDQKKDTAEPPQNACGANSKQHLGATKEKNTGGADCKHPRRGKKVSNKGSAVVSAVSS
jgi:hypothetical protein